MNMEIIVIGAGGHARTVVSILKEKNKEILVYDKPKYEDEKILGIDVNNIDDLFNNTVIETTSFIISIGDNSKRYQYFEKCVQHGMSPINVISKHASIMERVRMGRGNCIAPHSILCPEVEIGSNNIVNTLALIEHEVKIGDNCHIAPKACILGRVTIGNNVFVGANCTIKDKIKIFDDVVIGAGSVVTQDIETLGIYVGIPARKVK